MRRLPDWLLVLELSIVQWGSTAKIYGKNLTLTSLLRDPSSLNILKVFVCGLAEHNGPFLKALCEKYGNQCQIIA